MNDKEAFDLIAANAVAGKYPNWTNEQRCELMQVQLLASGYRTDLEKLHADLLAEIARLSRLVGTVRAAFNRECDDADAILRTLGLDPEKCRTDGGSLVMPELLGAIEHRDVMTRREAKPKWRPIETAPRDGKENVLLFDGKTVSAGGWTTDLDAGAEYEGQLGMFGWWWIEGGDCAPTHWMPLPTANRWQFGVPQSDEPQNAVQAAYGGLTQTAQG